MFRVRTDSGRILEYFGEGMGSDKAELSPTYSEHYLRKAMIHCASKWLELIMANFKQFTPVWGDEKFNTLFATEEDLMTDVVTFTFKEKFSARVHRNGHTEFFEVTNVRNGIAYEKTFKSRVKDIKRSAYCPHTRFQFDNGWCFTADFYFDHRCDTSQDIAIFSGKLYRTPISLVSE